MVPERKAEFRFYEELNDFLPKNKRKKSFSYSFKYNQTVKDAIESLGIPHAEVDLILVNGESQDFSYTLQNGDFISVYPVFESIDVREISKLRANPLRETRFVLDVHLGKLCKYLRMLGFDTYYRNDLDDDEIVKISITENRIILTRDIGILKNGQVTHGYWVRSQDSKKQLWEVIRRFDLQNELRPFYRCIVCNGLIDEVAKSDIEHQLRENTKAFFSHFYQCQTCGKIYWEGSHYENMQEFVDNVISGKNRKL
ncbi:MAG: Mut7-C ubiquitin/RNAse domain-containing protein [Bacteroidales bacterium]|nr:Mut7-C ubiquitin/RNAse domain-containing protein [Bacteroidales bacterium]